MVDEYNQAVEKPDYGKYCIAKGISFGMMVLSPIAILLGREFELEDLKMGGLCLASNLSSIAGGAIFTRSSVTEKKKRDEYIAQRTAQILSEKQETIDDKAE